MRIEYMIMIMLMVGIPLTLGVTFWIGGITDDIQYNHYKPNFDYMTCDEIGSWITEYRHNGNGFEIQIAKEQADLYPIMCGENGTHLDFIKPIPQTYSNDLDIDVLIYENNTLTVEGDKP